MRVVSEKIDKLPESG